MADSYAKKIQWKIEKMDPGSVFVRSDFAEIADSETLRRNLNRLTENGTLYRVQKGVYEKPKFNARLCGVTSAMGRIEAIAGIEQSWSSDTGQTVRSAE